MVNPAVLLEQYQNQDPSVRNKAIRQMQAFASNAEIVKVLCEALGDENKGVQNTSLDVLSNMRHEIVIKQLVESVKSSDLNVRNAAMSILRNIGVFAVDCLKNAIKQSQDVDEIIQILVVLGDVKTHLSTDTLIEYTTHPDDNVKTTAVESLGKVQDPKAVPVLTELYKTSDVLKYSIVEALGNIAVADAMPILYGALKSDDIIEYFTAIGALGATEFVDAVNPLFEKLISEEDEGTGRLIIKSLAQIEASNKGTLKKLDINAFRPIIKKQAKNIDAAEYKFVIQVAAALNDCEYVDILLNALQHSDAEVVDTAFAGLVALGDPVVEPALAKLGDVNAEVAIKILNILEKFNNPNIPQKIVRFTTNSNDALRQALARTLSVNPCETAFMALKDLLEDVDENVRKFAVMGISKMLTFDGALNALVRKFKDINGHVRREACLAMKNSNSEQVVEPLFNVVNTEPYGDVREAAASVLALRKEPEITKKLLEMLDSDNSRIRETIAKTIWQCGSVRAVESLISKLQDKEWRVIVNACNSLENLTDLKAIFPLKELLKNGDWQIRVAALSALRSFKSKELKQFFVPLLNDENPQVAKLAVAALSEIGDKSVVNDFEKFINHGKWEVRYQIVKALGGLKIASSVKSLINVVENDDCNAVKYCAIEALSAMDSNDASTVVAKVLDNEDENLVIAAIKYFKAGDRGIGEVKDKIKLIFTYSPTIRNHFIATFAENQSSFLEEILKSVIAPRQARLIDQLKNNKSETGEIGTEEALWLRNIIAEKCGLDIANKAVLKNKLAKNLPKFFISSWLEYYHSLRYGAEEGSDILISLYDSVTTPTTEFFGEAQQNTVMINSVLPELIESRVKAGAEVVRILCCGSSFGPEAYSVAMSVLEDLHTDKVKVSVTGIDISHICLNTAKRGIYKREMFRNIDQKYIDQYFEDDRGDLRVKDSVKNMVEFKFTNTVNSEAMEQLGYFDVVICRNLFTDFSQKGSEKMADNIYNILVPGGAMLISSKESLYNVTKAFKLQSYDKVVAYRKL